MGVNACRWFNFGNGFGSGSILMSVLDQYVILMCSFFWGMQSTPETKTQRTTCEDIVIVSLKYGEDPALMLSIAWNESRFFPKSKSRVGAIGPMQVMPKYWCPGGKAKNCDLVDAGFRAWRTYMRLEKGDEYQALCRYGSGKRCEKSLGARRYAKRVQRTKENLTGDTFSSWHEQWTYESCIRCEECCVQVTGEQ